MFELNKQKPVGELSETEAKSQVSKALGMKASPEGRGTGRCLGLSSVIELLPNTYQGLGAAFGTICRHKFFQPILIST